jgi:hypothetical protein
MLVARIRRRAGLQPHRLERYILSDDPDFEPKAADIIGLYLGIHRSTRSCLPSMKRRRSKLWTASIPCCRSRPDARNAMDSSTTPRHALAVRRAEHEDRRDYRPDCARHTSEAFVDFLRDVLATQPRRRDIHVIVDNLSAHKTKRV